MPNSKPSYLKAFERFLIQEKVEEEQEYKNSDIRHHVLAIMIAIQSNNLTRFEESLSEIKKRRLDESSQWIYDDILVFVLTVGALKFNESRSWVSELCLLRMNNQSDDKRSFTESLHFLLNGSHLGLPHINAICWDIVDLVEKPEEEIILEAYSDASRVLNSNDDDLNKLIAKSAIQSVLKFKGLDNLKERKEQKAFINRFENRTNLLSKILFWIVFIALIPTAVFVSFIFITSISSMEEGWIKSFLEYLLSPLISLGSFSFIFIRRREIIKWLDKYISRFWGKTYQE